MSTQRRPDFYRAVLPAGDMSASVHFWSTLLELEIDLIAPTRQYLHTAGAILALVEGERDGDEEEG